MKRKWMHAVVAVLVAAALAGCAGGARSGTNQPGVDAPTASGQPAAKESLNRSSEADVAAALRRSDVDDPEGWAHTLIGSRPYPPGQQGLDRIRQVLTEHDAEPAEVDKIMATVEP